MPDSQLLKPLFALIGGGLLACAPLPGYAQCEGPDLWLTVWPRDTAQVIQPRQIFLFGGGTDYLREGAEQLGRSRAVYLWSAHDSVALRVLERISQPDGYVQLLLQPSRPLLPDSVYELRAETITPKAMTLFITRGKPGTSPHRWRVATRPDTQAPSWLATPTVVKKEYSVNSEGVNNYVLFSAPVRDASAYVVRATIRHMPSGQQIISYVLPWQQQLPFGWFTCGGDIRFESQEAYSITLEAIDAAGNRASATGAGIRFQAPTKVASPWGY